MRLCSGEGSISEFRSIYCFFLNNKQLLGPSLFFFHPIPMYHTSLTFFSFFPILPFFSVSLFPFFSLSRWSIRFFFVFFFLVCAPVCFVLFVYIEVGLRLR